MRPVSTGTIMQQSRKEKPLALLIPGLDGTGKLFYRQIPALSERYRVVAWEFRRRGTFDFDDLVDEVVQGTGSEPPHSITLVGESFGGPIAMSCALRFPERFKVLALINTFPAYRRRIRIRLACRLAPLLNAPGIWRAKNLIVDRILKREGILEEDRLRYREIIRGIHPPAYRRRLELVRDVSLRKSLGKISVPTHIFAGGRDKVVPSVREGRYMAERIPGSQLHILPDAGHALLFTPGFSLADYL
jgi:pimeloyl-ACP methyl ester carboxylesterase